MPSITSQEVRQALNDILTQDFGINKANVQAILANVLKQTAEARIDSWLERTDLSGRFENMLRLAIENRLAQLRPAEMAETINQQIKAALVKDVEKWIAENVDFKLRPKPKQGRALINE